MARITVDPITGCWNVPGGKRRYGSIRVGAERQRTHRVAYEMFVGPIPDGEEIHHRCENKACCNPEHLQPTTRREHQTELTPNSIMYRNKRKTRCPKGHPLSGANLRSGFLRQGARVCATCQRETERASYERDIEKSRLRKREATARWRAKQKTQ